MDSPTGGFPLSFHLNTEKTMRGGEVQCLGLLRFLAARGRDCVLAAPRGFPLARKAAEKSLEVFNWNPRGEWDLWSAFSLRRRISRNRPVILHAHTAHALTHAIIAARGRKLTKVVATRRVSFPLRSSLSRLKYNSADAVVAVSGKISLQLRDSGLPEEKVSVIHSGVDLERFLNIPSREEARKALAVGEDSIVIGSAGALVAHKGHAVMLEALGRLSPPAGKQFEVLIAGCGELAGEIKAKAQERGLNLRLLDFVEDVRPFYAALDLFVLPSLSGEGSPGVLKEAAASGIPIVASDVGGSAEILRHEREALLVEAGRADALAKAISGLLEEKKFAEGLARKAKKRVEEFTMEKMASAYESLYKELFSV